MKNTNWSLKLALALPVLMILIVTLSIYLPTRTRVYRGKFLYAVQESAGYSYFMTYKVDHGKLQEVLPAALSSGTVRYPITRYSLYVHDLKTNSSRNMTTQEAEALTLDPQVTSTEGLEIVCGNRMDGFIPFLFSSIPDCSTMYAQGHHGSLKLNLRLKPGGYYNQFQFIGWVQS